MLVLTFLSSAMLIWLVFQKLLKMMWKKWNFQITFCCMLAVAQEIVCRSLHGLLWNKQVWIKQLAVEGAKSIAAILIDTSFGVDRCGLLLDSLFVKFGMNVRKIYFAILKMSKFRKIRLIFSTFVEFFDSSWKNHQLNFHFAKIKKNPHLL